MIYSLIEQNNVTILELDGNVNIKKNHKQLEEWLKLVDTFIM